MIGFEKEHKKEDNQSDVKTDDFQPKRKRFRS